MTRLCRDQRGAVLAEFAVVVAPVVLGFLGTWQLAELYATRLVVQRAAMAAARAAVVVLPDDPRWYDTEVNVNGGTRQRDVEAAAALVLVAAPAVEDFSVSVSGSPSEFNDLTVTVTATTTCITFVCGVGRQMDITATTTQAYHGARYNYDL